MKYTKLAFALAFTTTTLFLTACGSDNDNNDSSSTPSPPAYVSEVAYDLDSLDEAASIQVMNYKMPNVRGETVETSALVMFPKITQPKDGYRIVVWAHGTLGVADKCAPTRTALGANFKNYTAKNLLAAGYVVVAPDYEGLGGAGIHPYLNIPSEAKSAIYAVKALKEKYAAQLNGQWMSVGQSQGGQASLGIAEYANADVTYKGAVAGAPASSLGQIILEVAPAAIDSLSQPVAINTYATLLSYAALAGAGITAYEPTFDYRSIFKSTKAKELAETAETECLDEMINAYQVDIAQYIAENPELKVTQYPGIDADVFKQDVIVQKFLTDYSQPTTEKLNKPILIIQGVYDTNVPYAVTLELYNKMRTAGTNVSLLPVTIQPSAAYPVVNGSHTGAILAANESGHLMQFIQQHMPAH